MKVYLIAGEQSGDTHGGEVIGELRKISPNLELRGVGGQQLADLGQQQIFTTKQMELIGITQVLMSVTSIYHMLHAIIKDMDEFKPDLIILVDYPGFNLRLAKRIREQAKCVNNTTVVYYIPPKVWLWGYGRIFQLKKYVDKVFCIYPHEQGILQNEGVNATYAGNPVTNLMATADADTTSATIRQNLVSQIQFHSDHQKQRFTEGQKILGWFPGSRVGEITNNYKKILQGVEQIGDDYVVVAALPVNITPEQFYELIGTTQVNILYNKTHQLMEIAHIAWAASGTVTLELAIKNVPTIIYYYISQPSLAIGKAITGIKRIGIVNIILDDNVMPELINSHLNTRNLIEHTRLLEENRGGIQKQLQRVETLFGKHNPAQTVARWIAE